MVRLLKRYFGPIQGRAVCASLDLFAGLQSTFFIVLDRDLMVTVVSVIVRKHVLDVDLCFPNPRYVALHPMDSCIIRCECQPQISIVEIQ